MIASLCKFAIALALGIFLTQSVHRTRRHDTKRFLPKSEKEVFDILGLPWIDPTMRNADV